MPVTEILGAIGTMLVIAGYVPQVRHLAKEHCSAGISLPAFLLWCASSILFLIHAVVIRDPAFISVQIVSLAANGLIAFYARRYQGQFCPTHGGLRGQRG